MRFAETEDCKTYVDGIGAQLTSYEVMVIRTHDFTSPKCIISKRTTVRKLVTERAGQDCRIGLSTQSLLAGEPAVCIHLDCGKNVLNNYFDNSPSCGAL